MKYPIDDPSITAEFLLSRTRKTESGCLEWTRARGTFGYGEISIKTKSGRKRFDTHRLMWILKFGDPGDLYVCHKCDNPPCINPDHLFIGTQRDNMLDMISKGRTNIHLPGTKNPMAKLSEDQVREIRSRIASGETQIKIARSIPISPMVITLIKQGKIWTCVK